MKEIITEIINQYGYMGVFLLIMTENVFPPIPSEIILTLAGFMTTYTKMNVWGVILAATIGSVVGAIMLYTLGKILNANRLERIIHSRLGRILHLKSGDIKQAEKWFLRQGNKAVFLGRLVPIVRSLISIPAGVAKMKLVPFVALTTIGTLIWNAVLVFLGRMMGEAWERVAHYVDVYAMMAVVVLGLIAASMVFLFVKNRILNRENCR